MSAKNTNTRILFQDSQPQLPQKKKITVRLRAASPTMCEYTQRSLGLICAGYFSGDSPARRASFGHGAAVDHPKRGERNEGIARRLTRIWKTFSLLIIAPQKQRVRRLPGDGKGVTGRPLIAFRSGVAELGRCGIGERGEHGPGEQAPLVRVIWKERERGFHTTHSVTSLLAGADHEVFAFGIWYLAFSI